MSFVPALLLLTALAFSIPEIFVTKTVSPDTVFYEGAPAGSRATVTLRAYASDDSVVIGGSAADVFFVFDNSTSMGFRAFGAGFVLPPPAISFSQGAYNAAVNFIDSFIVGGNNRVGGMVFDWYMPLIAPLTSEIQDTGFAVMKGLFDQNVGYSGTLDSGGRGSRIYDGLDSAISYMQNNARQGVKKVIILITDGDNFWSTHYLADVVNRLNTINASAAEIQVHCIDIGPCSDQLSQNMADIAAAGEGVAAFTCSGTGIDSIVHEMGQDLSTVAAYRISQSAPMVINVFGPNIHLVPNSMTFTAGAKYLAPAYAVDTTSTGLTRLSFMLDSVYLGHQMEVQYQITAAVTVPSMTPALMRTNNTQGDDPTYYSLLQYKKNDSTSVTQSITKNSIWVKSEIGGLKLSMTPASLVPPSVTGTLTLPYTVTVPARYPSTASPDTFWYALIQLLATNTATYSQAASTLWNFNPDPAWTATRFNNNVGSAMKVGVTVSYNHAGGFPLNIQAVFNGVTYKDSLFFAASDNSTVSVESVQRTPSRFALGQNTPNPFHAATLIRYEIPAAPAARAKLEVFDLSGRKVETLYNGPATPGYHSAGFGAKMPPSGIYVYRLTVKDATGRILFAKTRNMALVN